MDTDKDKNHTIRETIRRDFPQIGSVFSPGDQEKIIQECSSLLRINSTLVSDFLSLLTRIPADRQSEFIDLNVRSRFGSKLWDPKTLSVFYENVDRAFAAFDGEIFRLWLELGGIFSKKQMNSGSWFWKESIKIFEGIGPLSFREEYLKKLLHLSLISWMTAFNCLQYGTSLLAHLTREEFTQWLDAVTEIAVQDIESSLSCIDLSEKMRSVLKVERFIEWIQTGSRLSAYGKKISRAYFRITPEFFKKTNPDNLGFWVKLVIHLLEKTEIMRADVKKERDIVGKTIDHVSHDEIRRRAHEHLEVAIQFIENTPKVLEKMTIHQLEDWVLQGIKIIEEESNSKLRLRKGKIFFSLQSQTSHDVANRTKYAVHLEHIHENLKYFVQALYGTEILIRPIQTLGGKILPFEEELCLSDGEKIYLPFRVSRFPSEKDNYNFYKIMVAHEMCHILLGTYSVDWSKKPENHKEWMPKKSLENLEGFYWQFLDLFPNATFARHLFEWVEDDRIDLYLFREYPGLKRDAGALIKTLSQDHPDSEASPLGRIFNIFYTHHLLDLPLPPVSSADRDVLQFLENAYEPIRSYPSTVYDSVRLTIEIYDFLLSRHDAGGLLNKNVNVRLHRPEYRGSIDFEQAQRTRLRTQKILAGVKAKLLNMELDISEDRIQATLKKLEGIQELDVEAALLELGDEETSLKKKIDKVTEKLVADQEDNKFKKIVFYDEWDNEMEDYKKGWCKVREMEMSAALDNDFARKTLADYHGEICQMNKYFRMIRPDRFKRLFRQENGDDIDMNAAIEMISDRRAGSIPDDRIYIQRDKRERDVATAFLVDMSSSTEEKISEFKRIIDIEKEALLLMSEAINALGDRYAIYGFSSDGRMKVDYFIIKEFQQTYSEQVQLRIGNIHPMDQTRMASAIRHTISKLDEQDAIIKLMILLIDGRPSDLDYRGLDRTKPSTFYTVPDTRMALQEAKHHGIHTFCITVDKKSREYLPQMFGGINYVIIDEIETLPTHLPLIYRKLTV